MRYKSTYVDRIVKEIEASALHAARETSLPEQFKKIKAALAKSLAT
jgi:hypothetical protein